jgi:hypothetical protein
MLDFLPAPVRGVIAALLLALNTILLCSFLFCVALIKVLPFALPASGVSLADEPHPRSVDQQQQRLDEPGAAHALAHQRPCKASTTSTRT